MFKNKACVCYHSGISWIEVFLSVKDNAGNFYKIYTGNKNSAGLFALTVLLF